MTGSDRTNPPGSGAACRSGPVGTGPSGSPRSNKVRLPYSASAGGRAYSNFGMTDRLPASIPPAEAIYTPKEELSIRR
jgi:hypothetical protein